MEKRKAGVFLEKGRRGRYTVHQIDSYLKTEEEEFRVFYSKHICNGHYLIMEDERGDLQSANINLCDVRGLAHNREEADRKAYGYALKEAKRMAFATRSDFRNMVRLGKLERKAILDQY